MSDISNMVAAVTNLDLEEVVDLLGLPYEDGSDHHLVSDGRSFFVDIQTTFGLGYNVTGKRGPTASVSFSPFLRGLQVSEDMLTGETAVVKAFLNRQDVMPSGFYGFEDFPYLQWDWQDYGVQLNSHPEWWHRVESRVLRRQLQEANIPFQARKLTARPARCGLRWWPEGAEDPVRLWAWYRTGADELRASLDLLAATLSTAGTFTPYRREPNSYTVEIEALGELIHQIVTTAETEPSRLAVVPQWPDALTKALALLINCGRPLPTTLTGRWEATVADAEALAPQLLENPKPLV